MNVENGIAGSVAMKLIEGTQSDNWAISTVVGVALKNGLLTKPKDFKYQVFLRGHKYKGLGVGNYKVTVERI